MDASLFQPLAARMRPRNLDEFFGQAHLLSTHKPLRQLIEKGYIHSMILWGPPGTGKTTLADILAEHAHAQIERISAVSAGVKEIKAVVERAFSDQQQAFKKTILFVDEIHRFNKTQQDLFLPYLEEGLLTLIGATTENPSFSLNNALLSRIRIYMLKPLETSELILIMQQALNDKARGFKNKTIIIEPKDLEKIAMASSGDARKALTLLEIVVQLATDEADNVLVRSSHITDALSQQVRMFDREGDIFFEQISALHKAVRGSSPDAALYWLCRMLDGGCDPLYIARRIVRMASEDIGNADPRALQLAMNAYEVQERLGSPEGELALAQAILYLATAAKSNACYVAFKNAVQDVKQTGSLEVPLHLRNAPTGLMKSLGYGKEYRYAHDEPHAYACNVNYFPEELKNRQYYFPVERGLEIKIKEKLEFLKKLEQKTNKRE